MKRAPLFAADQLVAGRFQVVRFLGSGQIGEVYEAEDLELKERVALKTIRPELAQDERAMERFRREIRIARRVTHPNVCRTFDVFAHRFTPPPGWQGPPPEVTLLSMELLEGQTLAERIRSGGPLTTEEALPIVRQMAAALAAAHDAEIVHRDFTSANVALVPSRKAANEVRVVVTDFALARGTATTADGALSTSPGALPGSTAYLAPEQVEGGTITPATDVYALGVVMYEMLTAKRPFEGDSPLATAMMRLKQRPISPRTHVPDLDPRWESAILRCLEREPAGRFESALDVVKALVAARDVGLGRRARRWIGPAVAASVLAAMGVGLWHVRSARSRVVPAAPPAAPGAIEQAEPGSLVVMPVLVHDESPQTAWLRQGVAEMIRSELGQAPGIHVVPRHRLAGALTAAGADPDQAPLSEKALEVARKLRAERLITGSFVRLEDRFDIIAEIIDAGSGRTEGLASVRGRKITDLIEGVDELCKKLRPLLGSAEEAKGPQLARLGTRSTEAARYFVEALTWFAKGGREGAEEAEKRLDAAVKLDPSFAQAYVKKAEIQEWRRRWAYGDPDSVPAVRAAAAHVENLSERDRLLVAGLVALVLERRPAEAVRQWTTLLRAHTTYAREIGVPSLVADVLLREARWDELIALGEAHVDSPSLPGGERALLSSQIAQAFRAKGDVERAVQYARRAVEAWPTRRGPRFLDQRALLGRVYLIAGRRDAALAEFRAAGVDAEAEALNLTQAAWGLYMAGEAKEAAALVERALARDASYGNAHHLRGWLLLATGRYAEAAASLETAFERTPLHFGNPSFGTAGGDLAALYYAGVAWQKASKTDQTDRAAAVFAQLADRCRTILREAGQEEKAARWQAANFLARAAARQSRPPLEPPSLEGDPATYFVQSARLHALQGRKRQALEEIAKGVAAGYADDQHMRDDPDFESLRADPEFARLVQPRAAPGASQ